MINSGGRAALVALFFSTLSVFPARITAQQLNAPASAIDEIARDTQPPSTPPQGTGQKVAEAEEPAKPTRSFIPALFHNLGDDIKHIPRKNTIYWLAAGTAASLAVHPADDYLNNHLSTSPEAKDFFVVGKYLGSFPVLHWGRGHDLSRRERAIVAAREAPGHGPDRVHAVGRWDDGNHQSDCAPRAADSR